MKTEKGFVNKSRRLKRFNYNSPAAYFITICTNNRKCVFGSILNGKMILNELGLIAEKTWKDIPLHFKNTDLGSYVIMPNHIHGIINICYDLSSPYESSLRLNKANSKKLPSIIGSYKSAVTKRNQPPDFDF